MMLDTIKVSDDLTDSARQYRANILDVVSAMECALAGKPHPRINTLTPEQRFWRMLGLRASNRPPTRERWEHGIAVRKSAAEARNRTGLSKDHGYGQGRKMGD